MGQKGAVRKLQVGDVRTGGEQTLESRHGRHCGGKLKIGAAVPDKHGLAGPSHGDLLCCWGGEWGGAVC